MKSTALKTVNGRQERFTKIAKASLSHQAFAYAIHDNRTTMCREWWDLYPDGRSERRFVCRLLMIEVTRIWQPSLPPWGSYPDVGKA